MGPFGGEEILLQRRNVLAGTGGVLQRGEPPDLCGAEHGGYQRSFRNNHRDGELTAARSVWFAAGVLSHKARVPRPASKDTFANSGLGPRGSGLVTAVAPCRWPRATRAHPA